MKITYDRKNFYDEMFDSSGAIRPHYRYLAEQLEKIDETAFTRKRQAVDLAFLQRGITFTLYGNEETTERIFPFDLIPRIIPNSEWQQITRGLEQRIRALNLFLHDVYNDQKIIKDNVIPRGIVESAPYFRPEFMGFDVPEDIYIHVCGTDLIRDDKGHYLVLEDNARSPSGVSYMLENRRAMKRAFPNIFPKNGVLPISNYTKDLLQTLKHICPQEKPDPCVVVLTPGVYNSAYFEHCFLAKQMGVDIVEGRDLIVEDDCVFMKTTEGQKQVDVIYRRIDDDFIDPEVFRKDSLLGVRGLVRAYRNKRVALANSIGTGVADDKVVYYYVPQMIKYYLDQNPILPNVETWLASNEKDLQHILKNMDRLVVKAANEAGGYGMLIGPASSKEEVDAFRSKVRANPRNYIAQQPISLSRHPTCFEDHFYGCHIDLRPYILFGETIKITPGGLTRVALRKDSLVVNSSQGGGSKDTWVLQKDE